jgi:cell division protein FtsB
MDKLEYQRLVKEVPLSKTCLDVVVIQDRYIKHLEAVNENYSNTIIKLRTQVKKLKENK